MYETFIFEKFFLYSLKQDPLDFLSLVDHTFYYDQSILFDNKHHLKKDFFYIIINAFENFMNYSNINEDWQTNNVYPKNTSTIDLVQKTKQSIQQILIKGILQCNYINLMFVFHQNEYVSTSIETIYKLLINSLVDIENTNPYINVKRILRFYLLHAATYNNSAIIKILLEEYHVSPIKTWPAINHASRRIEAMVMPIIQLTLAQKHGVDKQLFNISFAKQESNFILMLNNIDYMKIQTWQTQEIFRCAFKHKFIEVIKYLITQESFCEKLAFTEEDLMMMAFCFIVFPEYTILINTIINEKNVLQILNHISKDKLKNYIDMLHNINQSTFKDDNHSHMAIKLAQDFLDCFLEGNQENEFISKVLKVFQHSQENLTQRNEDLLQQNLRLQEDILILQENLKMLTNKLPTLVIQPKTTVSTKENPIIEMEFLRNPPDSTLEKTCYLLQHTLQQRQNLNKLVNDTNITKPTCFISNTLDIESPIIKRRRHSFYL